MSENPTRKKNRLDGHDYSQAGAYFVTVCVKNRHELLGEIVGEAMIANERLCRGDYQSPAIKEDSMHSAYNVVLNEYGVALDKSLKRIPIIYKNVILDKYVIMPNHLHMILVIRNSGRLIIAPTISQVIKQLKSSVTKQLGFSLWQRSYHDHIIRNHNDYIRIAEYIESNPARWTEDMYYIKH